MVQGFYGLMFRVSHRLTVGLIGLRVHRVQGLGSFLQGVCFRLPHRGVHATWYIRSGILLNTS